MFRLRDRTYGLLAALVTTLQSMSPSAHPDEVTALLERHHLNGVLATHLEAQLEQASGEPREALLLQLAALYANLLERASTAEQRQELEQRCRRVLEQAPQTGSEELRLALLRANYRSAEKIAENHRLRMATPDELELAKRVLAEITPQLAALRQRIKENLTSIERRQGRSFGPESASINDSAERTRNMLAQCTFVNAWALYYQAWLSGQREAAQTAEPLFAELLMTES